MRHSFDVELRGQSPPRDMALGVGRELRYEQAAALGVGRDDLSADRAHALARSGDEELRLLPNEPAEVEPRNPTAEEVSAIGRSHASQESVVRVGEELTATEVD